MDRGQGISRRAFLCRTGALGVAGVVAGCPTAGAREAGASPFAPRLPVPPFPPNLEWVNAGPVDLGRLRGHFVLLDFWTLGCINCMHLIPELRKLEKAWPDELVVIGVHSAKFESERDIQNIQAAGAPLWDRASGRQRRAVYDLEQLRHPGLAQPRADRPGRLCRLGP